MKEIFDDYILTTFGAFEQAEFKFKQFELNYQRFFPKDKGARILDIGIGRGEMLTCFKKWGYPNYIGIDISPSTIQFCQSLDLNCVQVDDTTSWLQQHPKEFDVITLLDVLEHIKKEETIPLLRAINNSLKDMGILLVQVPNLQAPDSQLHMYHDFTHQSGFIEDSLHQVLLTAGFKNSHTFPFDDSIAEGWKEHIRLILRGLYWKSVRFRRKINGNLNPSILTPIFFAVAAKE